MCSRLLSSFEFLTKLKDYDGNHYASVIEECNVYDLAVIFVGLTEALHFKKNISEPQERIVNDILAEFCKRNFFVFQIMLVAYQEEVQSTLTDYTRYDC